MKPKNGWDSAVEIEWKTFAGGLSESFTALILIRAQKDKIDTEKKDNISEYFRVHIERGIHSLQNVTTFEDYISQ